MIEIFLTQNKIALIDDTDYEVVRHYHWYTRKTPHNYYAVTHSYRGGKRTTLAMHQLIMPCNAGQQIDHIDGNGLNNQKANLRICTHQENNWNRHYTYGTSKYKGVSWSRGKWQATIKVNNKAKFLGYFTDEKEAAAAYNEAALEYFGGFARLNTFEEIQHGVN